ncbi:MAG: hypothetical protein MIO93_12010, partial [ANME-2 cluster archaeon]|nr:hypothetical protein [ANME-2 cluster archaeon]
LSLVSFGMSLITNMLRTILLFTCQSQVKRLDKDLPPVVEKWKEKENRDRKLGIEPEKELINYADFGDYNNIFETYKKIYSRNDEDFGDAKVQLKNWYNYGRNPIMHSRTIDEEKFYSTKTAIRWIE